MIYRYMNAKICPQCGQEQLKVVDSREHYGTIKRKKKCLNCDYVVNTLELLEDDVNNIMENEVLYNKLLQLDQEKLEILNSLKTSRLQ